MLCAEGVQSLMLDWRHLLCSHLSHWLSSFLQAPDWYKQKIKLLHQYVLQKANKNSKVILNWKQMCRMCSKLTRTNEQINCVASQNFVNLNDSDII